MLALGTSITFGQGSMGQQWPVQLSQYYNGLYPGKFSIQNSAISGSNSRTGGLNIIDNQLATYRPNLVVLEFTTNDAYAPYNISVSQSVANFTALVEKIKLFDSSIEVIGLTGTALYNSPNYAYNSSFDRPNVEAYNLGWKTLADATPNVYFSDPYSDLKLFRDADLVSYSSSYVYDGVHALPLGQTIFSDNLVQTIATVPESSSVLLITFGCIALFLLRRRAIQTSGERESAD